MRARSLSRRRSYSACADAPADLSGCDRGASGASTDTRCVGGPASVGAAGGVGRTSGAEWLVGRAATVAGAAGTASSAHDMQRPTSSRWNHHARSPGASERSQSMHLAAHPKRSTLPPITLPSPPSSAVSPASRCCRPGHLRSDRRSTSSGAGRARARCADRDSFRERRVVVRCRRYVVSGRVVEDRCRPPSIERCDGFVDQSSVDGREVAPKVIAGVAPGEPGQSVVRRVDLHE